MALGGLGPLDCHDDTMVEQKIDSEMEYRILVDVP